MPIAKKDRFMKTDLKIPVGDVGAFPPDRFCFEEQEFDVLGKSNKETLIPTNINSLEMQEIVTYGNLGQYICTDQQGNLHDVCFYKGVRPEEKDKVFLYAIMTREKPEKQKECGDNA